MKKIAYLLVVIVSVFTCKNDKKNDITPTENKTIENKTTENKPVVTTMLDSYKVGIKWIYRNGQDNNNTTGNNPSINWYDNWTDTLYCVNDTNMNGRRWVLIRKKGNQHQSNQIFALSDSAGYLINYERNLDVGEDYRYPHYKFMNRSRWLSAFIPEYASQKNIGDTIWQTQNRVFWYGYLHENELITTPAGQYTCKMFGLCMTQISNMRTQHANCMEKNYYSEKVGLVLSISNHFGLNNYRELVYFGDIK